MYNIPDIDLTPPDYPEGEKKYPTCECCNEKIKSKYYYLIGVDKIMCLDCLNENFRMETDDYDHNF